ncbi:MULTISPECIES: bifunctional DNA-formamidopyrimidine glycosylase/DNA-(apurinic or apyrimidinic site) lyase [unclassified Salinivibrio]|uniref:bifunctional DNA-formamidopyrimidine glycosylase/DNA-(apurinic or apyrimidinic site) lyase n=1 Tax=unclassified Salinivibrio TaxID=2636825 RepID=UPI0006145BF9|nr:MULTISPECIES: bifunctional DNA-formamidopyrimidine glycosylase/DNA-(apurinic or apyrimidinic site) lyase [unclassified Salinivibrio]KKA44686.1 formamidopyrimidine-DNA glycosylase [Salinivibrio sp. KP-1]OOE68149.1 DNA-formamidopyrimidine glycosylase [Salinivibrio sp. IB868]OOE75445.1 DNA-formamidopyrimidine glycosylase [Salinivibrio sp. IB870]OOE80453.1 DNA-formamidopyrimidine glycosylase [Salinivibrio sp. ML198]
MPELPEVEVSRLGIMPYVEGQTVTEITIRQPKLRWPIPETLQQLKGQVIRRVTRRAKYLLLETDVGTAIVHLGMSGSLRVLPTSLAPEKHDHVDVTLSNGRLIRYHDPRRFGAWLWQEGDLPHPVLGKLGPEPLTDAFNSDYLLAKAAGKKMAMKSFIMDNAVVVGVGNIYANESLFCAGIHPKRPAGSLTQTEATALVDEIKTVLAAAITQGGTTLKDFTQVDGKAGYFAQALRVYGKSGEPCPACDTTLERIVIGQRATVFCPQCQPL